MFFLIGGLCSVVGAIVIALPDTPRLRMVLWSERVREGLYEIEKNGLTENKAGYEEVSILLEDIYEVEILEHSWGYRAGYHTLFRYGFEAIYLFTDPNNENAQIPLGKDLGNEVDFRTVRSEIKHRINTYQASVRAVGFILLSFSFGFQTVAHLI